MKLKTTKFQIAIEIISAAGLAGMFIYLFLKWGNIPAKVPMHYNLYGEINRWGNKSEIITVPIIALSIYLLLTFISFFPGIWNMPVTPTPENKSKIYSSVKSMLLVIKLELVYSFFFLTYKTANSSALSGYYALVILVVSLGTIIFFVTRVVKAGK
ncbi:MAG TPA: DUF1648 domain-containing protein [Mobilitalea sp.]|nr:DUF1648 domain-containing protein [Mobilitalea sp.]